MSIIAAKLHERKTAFISLHELLETIVKHDGCTLQDAAQFLHTTLSGLGEFDYIPWQEYGDLYFGGTDSAIGERLLRSVAVHGQYTEVTVPSWANDDIPF
ncbi:hypothetical protein [Giesbergeria anulus]|uniref:Uncharacterized protein n=1 Tax=Giesbergeria anulus TaxID=180197 RepID=A0A1H9G6E9_9BURK|nr:hypothetical protein [Giesbergeria anulus]SEQ45368.1 hypothetical protein SAMN02982919_00721 [Giesbergeria anulus]